MTNAGRSDAGFRAGIEFIDENGGGPGVRVRRRQRAKKQLSEGPGDRLRQRLMSVIAFKRVLNL